MENVKDIDGNSYKTVRIGDQIWMAENLKVIHYRNGDLIPNITDDNDWACTEEGAYCNYDNDESNVKTYGRLYNWFSVDDKRGLAPLGWHIPTTDEWDALMDNVEGDVEDDVYTGEVGKLILESKEKADMRRLYGPRATNESGFTALPGGSIEAASHFKFYYLGDESFFWSSTEYDILFSWYYRLVHFDCTVYKMNNNKGDGFSIRCVKD